METFTLALMVIFIMIVMNRNNTPETKNEDIEATFDDIAEAVGILSNRITRLEKSTSNPIPAPKESGEVIDQYLAYKLPQLPDFVKSSKESKDIKIEDKDGCN